MINAYKQRFSTPEDRFWTRVDKNGPICERLGTRCWVWTGGAFRNGKGLWGAFWYKGKNISVARAVLTFMNGDLPDGIFALHHCDNGLCCNPDHLFLGTPQDNMDDKTTKKRNNVPRGEDSPHHKLTAEQVEFIRSTYKPYDPQHSQFAIAKALGVSRGAIEGILRKDNWKHI